MPLWGKTFQHISFVSNAHVNLDFELKEQLFFREQGIFGEQKHKVMERGECIKNHRFNLDCPYSWG